MAGIVGERTGPRGTRGLEFADYRPYTPGDDLRRIDWNIYARLRELYIKTAPSEAHVDLALLLDGSLSMEEGSPSKFLHAQRLAAMLGAVALLHSDVVQVHMLADGDAWSGAPLAAPQLVLPLVAELARIPRGVRTDLARSVNAYRRTGMRADAAILLSDGLAPAEQLDDALRRLASSAANVALVHVLDDEELEPPLTGPVELRDRETGQRMIVDVTAAVREEYEQRFEELSRELRDCCTAHGVLYVRALTSVPPLDLLYDSARRLELVSL